MSEPTLELRDTFLAVLEALREARVDYAFIGALPVLAWGRVRATTDIDVVVLAGDDWQRLATVLTNHGITQRKQIGPADVTDELPDVAVCYSAHASPVRVDVFIAKTDFERAAIDTARQATVFDTTVRLATPEASIIYKLLARRPRDLDDVESIFAARAAAGETLDWEFLGNWAEQWGIEKELEAYRSRYGPGD